MNQPDGNSQTGSKPKIVVFCGHPCSGKSTAFRAFLDASSDFHPLEMDDVRTSRIPGPIHDKSRREAAYRVMHFEAMQALRQAKSVALAATYTPTKARAEIAEMARRTGADLYVVQCVCDGQIAVDRFLKRLKDEPNHAGADLSVSRVRELANEYSRFDQGFTIDTTSDPTPTNIQSQLRTYLSSAAPVEPCAWALHWYANTARLNTQPPTDKLSEAIVRKSKRSVFWHWVGLVSIYACLLLGCLPLFLYSIVHAQTELEKHPWSFARDILVGITSSSWTDQATWSTFAIAAAGIIGIFLLFYKETSEKRNRAESIGNAGKVPTFRLPEGANETPSDREIYYSYQCRIATDEERAKMPIHELPVYFLIPPQKGRSFRAIVSSERKQPASNLPSDAAGLGLDWSGFTAWRWDAYCTDYALKANGAENNLRCVSNPRANPKAGEYIIPGSRCLYTDYVVRELSVNLCAPGTLPDMRRLFEGPQWDEGTLDLSDCSAGASRYSLRISVTGILLTQDEYFVLQRRSTRVASGIGSLGASVAGAADFQKDRYGLMIPRIRPRRWNLEKSIRRELKEETGIKNLRESLHPGPFLGAALNLRYGRDLNFYALLQTPENTWDLSAYRKKRAARDRWEVDRLEFLDSRLVTQRSILRGELELHLPGRSRHLMGALYAWTVFADKK